MSSHIAKFLIGGVVALTLLMLLAGLGYKVLATPVEPVSQPLRVEQAPPTPLSVAPADSQPPPAKPAPVTATPAPTFTAIPSATPTGTPPLTAVLTETAACPCSAEHVVLISIDGLRPDALEQAETPVLDALRAGGAYSPSARAVLPSVTLVNHASMLAGTAPEKHGINWNTQDPDLGLVTGPTLFSLVREAGFSTAMVVGKPKLEHLVLPGSVDAYIYAGYLDIQVVNEALPLIEAGLPDLLFIHLPDVDSAGHATGWMSLGQLVAINRTDSLIGEILAALDAGGYLDRTLVIVTSDHGGSGRRHGSDSPEDTTVPWLAAGPDVPAGVIIEQDIVMYDTAATILYAFGLPAPAKWDGRPITEIFR